MALLKKTKVQTLEQLNESVRRQDPTVLKALSTVNLTVRQRSLIAHFAYPMSLLSSNPNVHLLMCGDCGAYSLLAESGPSKCQITYGCLSKNQHRSLFAKYLPADEEIPAEEDSPYNPEGDGRGDPQPEESEEDRDDADCGDWPDEHYDEEWTDSW